MVNYNIDDAIKAQKKKADFNRSMYDMSLIKDKNQHLIVEAEKAEKVIEWLDELKKYREMYGGIGGA